MALTRRLFAFNKNHPGRGFGSSIRKPRSLLSYAAWLALAWSVAPALAQAGDVDDTVHLRNGGRIRGVVISDDGNWVDVRLPSGKTRTLKRQEVTDITYGASESSAPATTSPVQNAPIVAPPPNVQAPNSIQLLQVQSLLKEKQDWQHRRTGVVVPIIFTALGVAAIGSSIGLAAGGTNEYDGTPFFVASAITAAVGTPLLITGIVLFATRTSGSHQRQELDRINMQLNALGYTASLIPWFTPRTSQLSGASGGLRLSVQF